MFAYLADVFRRDRRRLGFVTGLAFLAGFIFYARLDATIFGLPVPLVTGAIYAIVVAPVAFLVCAFLPSLRFMIEAIALSRLVLSVFVFAAPGIGAHILASPLLMAMIVVSGGGILSRVLHGQLEKPAVPSWKDRWFRRHPVRVMGNTRQIRFVRWMDDTAPIAA